MPQKPFSLRTLLTPHFIIGAAVVAAVITVAGVFYSVSQKPSATYSTVTRGSIAEEVDATGVVKAAQSVDLSFQRGGMIASLPVSVGEHVGQGQTLASLSNADLAAAREQAQANLAAAQAKLAALQTGTRPEELASTRTSVAQALGAAYIAADDAVHNRVDQFITNPRSDNPGLAFSSSDTALQSSVLSERGQAENDLSALAQEAPQGDVSGNTGLAAQAQAARGHLLAIQSFLDSVNLLLTKAIVTPSVPLTTIQGYQTSISAGRTAVSSALQTLNAAAGKLSVEEAGSSAQDIEAAQAAAQAAQASLDAANASLAQSVIRAPFSGMVTRQDGDLGQVVTAGQSFLSLQSDAKFQTEGYVSEADVVKLKVGQHADVKLDAYPDATFSATVAEVAPAAVLQSGVPGYKVTAQFDADDPRLKAGLTANLAITAGEAGDSLLIPASAVITMGTDTYCLKLDANGKEELAPVKLGIIGNGQAQVLSGLSLGDRVASFGSAR